MDPITLLILALVGGVLIMPKITSTSPGGGAPTGPTSQNPAVKYPFQALQAPRLDNNPNSNNQPWASGSLTSQVTSRVSGQIVTSAVQGGITGLGNLWDSLSSGSGGENTVNQSAESDGDVSVDPGAAFDPSAETYDGNSSDDGST